LDRAEVSGQRVGSLSITRTRSGRKITSPAAAGLGPTAGSSAGDGDAAATAATASVMHSLLSFSWGFFADVDIESETMRWLGGLRFTIQAIVRILFLRRYSAKLRFKPLAITPDAVPAGKKSKELAIGQGAFYTLVPIRPRPRGERRSLRTFAVVSLRPPLAFNPDTPRRLSTPPDAFQLHPDVRTSLRVDPPSALRPDALNDTNALELRAYASDEAQTVWLMARLDNLGKGASGAAVQNMNLALGLPEDAGL
jgi:hypothetical protein